jgi:L-ascorbate metabolism protein UlaG (beta-lactamase superfamily)
LSTPTQVNEKNARSPGFYQVTFFGTTTLMIQYGTTALLTDGFFTRPSMKRVLFGKIAPDPVKIATSLSSASIRRLDAVLVGHSHYDHALDAPEVARQTGSLLVGSASTAQIGLGWGLPQTQIHIVQTGQPLQVRDLEVRFILSKHSQPLLYPGAIDQPLVPPAHASAYREGGSYTIVVSSPAGSILVQESANLIPGGLAEIRAGAVFLSIAQLSRRSPDFIRQYFYETVLIVGARRVIPIHWDNFQKSVRGSLEFFPLWMENILRAMRLIQELCLQYHIQYQVPPFGKAMEIQP